MIEVSQGPGRSNVPGRLHSILGRLLAALTLLFAVALPVGAVFAFSTQVAGASTDTVTNCNDSGAGSLRQTIADASAGDTIDFDLSPTCSLITETSGSITVDTNLTIDGPGASALAVSGGTVGTVSVFVVDNVTSTISGLTIKNGGLNGGTCDWRRDRQLGHAHRHRHHAVRQQRQLRRRRDRELGHAHRHRQHAVRQHR